MGAFRNASLGIALLALLAGCATSPVDREDRQDAAKATSGAGAGSDAPSIREAFLTEMVPADNIDSVASWRAPDGRRLLVATAKATDRLVVYDGETGRTLRGVGSAGEGMGQFDRPNGIAIVDDLLWVVERDNRRVQVMSLPDFLPLAAFGSEMLQTPYGLWVRKLDAGYDVYVTDAYMAGEDAQGEDILPPLARLDRRVQRFHVIPAGTGLSARHVGNFGDTTPDGALRVVESIWGDVANDRLLIAEEDESYANELKVYDLSGRYAGRTVGREVFKAQAEGIMLRTCAGGGGWWITTEQGKGRTVFHLFDRLTLQHRGAVAGNMVANTDGIWLHQSPTPRFPDGVLYAVHDDQGVVALDWRDIARTLSLPACASH